MGARTERHGHDGDDVSLTIQCPGQRHPGGIGECDRDEHPRASELGHEGSIAELEGKPQTPRRVGRTKTIAQASPGVGRDHLLESCHGGTWVCAATDDSVLSRLSLGGQRPGHAQYRSREHPRLEEAAMDNHRTQGMGCAIDRGTHASPCLAGRIEEGNDHLTLLGPGETGRIVPNLQRQCMVEGLHGLARGSGDEHKGCTGRSAGRAGRYALPVAPG